MRIFLTGASGLVGAAFARRAGAAGHEVVGSVHRFTGVVPGLARQLNVDLGDAAATAAALQKAAPAVIVNCAAVAEPPACAADPAGSDRLNVQLPALLARQAVQLGARLLHLSSEQVFDGGRTTPFTVADAPRPLNLYGEQKLAGEKAVLTAAPAQAVVVRLPLLTGDSANRQRSLHERYFIDWMEGRTPRLYTDEFRQTCSADSVATMLLALCGRPGVSGLRQWAGAELLSRFEIGRRVRAHFGLGEKAAPLVAVARADTPAVAATRPACLALSVAPLATELGLEPQPFHRQLAGLTVPPACEAWYRAQRA